MKRDREEEKKRERKNERNDTRTTKKRRQTTKRAKENNVKRRKSPNHIFSLSFSSFFASGGWCEKELFGLVLKNFRV
jgi:hypothetical protein